MTMPDSGLLTGTVSIAAFEQAFGLCTAEGLQAPALGPEWRMGKSALDGGWISIEVVAVDAGRPAALLSLVAKQHGDAGDVRIDLYGTDFASCERMAGGLRRNAALVARTR